MEGALHRQAFPTPTSALTSLQNPEVCAMQLIETFTYRAVLQVVLETRDNCQSDELMENDWKMPEISVLKLIFPDHFPSAHEPFPSQLTDPSFDND